MRQAPAPPGESQSLALRWHEVAGKQEKRAREYRVIGILSVLGSDRIGYRDWNYDLIRIPSREDVKYEASDFERGKIIRGGVEADVQQQRHDEVMYQKEQRQQHRDEKAGSINIQVNVMRERNMNGTRKEAIDIMQSKTASMVIVRIGRGSEQSRQVTLMAHVQRLTGVYFAIEVIKEDGKTEGISRNTIEKGIAWESDRYAVTYKISEHGWDRKEVKVITKKTCSKTNEEMKGKMYQHGV